VEVVFKAELRWDYIQNSEYIRCDKI